MNIFASMEGGKRGKKSPKVSEYNQG